MHRILVIEDDELTAEVLQSFLAFEGYEVHLAHTGAEALEKSASLRQDITISDWRLSDGVGAAGALPEIRKLLPDMHLILVTGSDLDEIESEMQALRVSKAFVKPVDLEEVVSVVKAITSARGDRGEIAKAHHNPARTLI